MIRRIELVNYMSHVRTVIEPAAGLTVLVGPNNCGKSAVVDALQTIAGRTRGDYMMRHGAKESSVTVKTDDHEITWRRRGAAITHVVDGQEIPRNRPEKAQEALRLNEVVADDGKKQFDVHFGVQKEPIFLLSGPGTDPAVFFAASSDAERLLAMQKLHRDKVRQWQRDLEQQKRVVEDENRFASTLNGVPEIEREIEAGSVLRQQIETVEAAAITMETLISRIADGSAEGVRETERCAAFVDLRPAPAVEDERTLQAQADRLALADSERRGMMDRLEAMTELVPSPSMEDEHALDILVRGIREQLRTEWACRAAAGIYESLRNPPLPGDVESVEAMCRELEEASANARRHQDLVQALEPLAVPTGLASDGAMQELIAKLELAARSVSEFSEVEVNLQGEIAIAEADLAAWAARHPICPLCGSAVTVEHLKHGGGGV